MTGVNIGALEQQAIGLLAMVLFTLASYALQRVGAYFQKKGITVDQGMWQMALKKAVAYGVQVSNSIIQDKGWDHVDTHNAILNSALSYIVSHNPDVLGSVGLSTNLFDNSNKARIMEALQSVLPDVVSTLAISPATPPAPATIAAKA